MNARIISDGEWKGFPVRRARKDHRCDGWNNSYGHATIAAGDYYVEGFMDPDRAGGFGHDRLCADCVDDAARTAIAKARGQS